MLQFRAMVRRNKEKHIIINTLVRQKTCYWKVLQKKVSEITTKSRQVGLTAVFNKISNAQESRIFVNAGKMRGMTGVF